MSTQPNSETRSLAETEVDAVSGAILGWLAAPIVMGIGTAIATDPDNPWNVGKNPKPCGRGNDYKC